MIISATLLDQTLGKPAEGVPVILQRYLGEGEWQDISFLTTPQDGTLENLIPLESPVELKVQEKALFRLTVDNGLYFQKFSKETLYPYIPIIFQIHSQWEHFHVHLSLETEKYTSLCSYH
jgi:5-hydroxyisourate hydrolase